MPPLPPLPQLPRWLWARMGAAARAAAVVGGLVLVVVVIVMAPRLADINRDNRATDRREAARAQAESIAAARALQRPRTVAAGAGLSRPVLRHRLESVVAADSRARPHTSPVKRVVCNGPPHAPSPEVDRRVRRGRFACTAVTADVANIGGSGGGYTGYPYRAVVDFDTGRITLCRVAGRPGEGSFVRRAVQLPAACSA